MGYKTKLDTNGTNPAILRELVEERVLDAIALDYKCPPQRAKSLLGTTLYDAAFRESLAYLIAESHAGHIQLEIRTTCHPDFLSADDVAWMIADLDQLHYHGTYWLQNIVARGDKTLGCVAAAGDAYSLQQLPSPAGFTLGFRNFANQATKLGFPS